MRLVSTLQNGQQLVEHTGTLRILFCPSSKIQFMELSLTSFEHFVNSKSENLFTLPLQAGFDQTVHNFLEMLVLVQASFGNIGGNAMGMGSNTSLPGLANLTLESNGYQPDQGMGVQGTMSPPQLTQMINQLTQMNQMAQMNPLGQINQIGQMSMRPNHLPTLLPKPPTPVEVPKPIQPAPPKQPPLKFEIYTPPLQPSPPAPVSTQASTTAGQLPIPQQVQSSRTQSDVGSLS